MNPRPLHFSWVPPPTHDQLIGNMVCDTVPCSKIRRRGLSNFVDCTGGYRFRLTVLYVSLSIPSFFSFSSLHPHFVFKSPFLSRYRLPSSKLWPCHSTSTFDNQHDNDKKWRSLRPHCRSRFWRAFTWSDPREGRDWISYLWKSKRRQASWYVFAIGNRPLISKELTAWASFYFLKNMQVRPWPWDQRSCLF